MAKSKNGKSNKIKILNNTPFGYENISDVLSLYVTPRFEKLDTSIDIGDYYDFINAGGLLLYWILNATGMKTNKLTHTLYLFKSFYNNIKHHDLTKGNNLHIIADYPYILKCRNGVTSFDENGVWNDMGYWHDDCSFLGDSGELPYILVINPKNNPPYNECNQIYLYEFCKRVYQELNKLVLNN